MTLKKVDFNEEWYNCLTSKSDEKDVLISKFKDIVGGGKHKSCLEIGLGTTAHFSDSISNLFEDYAIVEKEDVKVDLPDNVRLINSDWEELELDRKYDVILASHVIYYFKDKEKAIQKMFDSLNPEGIVVFVVNGKDADYGVLKLKFSELINEEYHFTYDVLREILEGKKIEEFSVPSTVGFKNAEDLFNTLKISFDMYPEEYLSLKKEMCSFFKDNFKNKVIFNQKIIVCKKDL